jgi:hypothetical protein
MCGRTVAWFKHVLAADGWIARRHYGDGDAPGRFHVFFFPVSAGETLSGGDVTMGFAPFFSAGGLAVKSK